MRKTFLVLSFLIVFGVSVHAQTRLTVIQVERLQAIRKLLGEAGSAEPLEKDIKTLEASGDPEVHLRMREAMAGVYARVVSEQAITDLKRRQWLYSMVALNMAYLQFSGGQVAASGEQNTFNRFLQQRLRESLSEDILEHPAFLRVIE